MITQKRTGTFADAPPRFNKAFLDSVGWVGISSSGRKFGRPELSDELARIPPL